MKSRFDKRIWRLATATAIFAFFALGSGVDGQVGYRPPSYPTGNPLPPSSDGPFRNTANSSSTATSRPTIPANDELRRLQAEMDALSRIQDGLIDDPVPSGSDNNAERAKLKERLIELIEKLKSTSRSGGNTSNSRPSVFEQNPDAPPIDRLKQAEALYRAGEIRTAQKVLQSIDPASLGGKPAALARYLRACCHRRLGEYDQARQLYRDIAASKDDAFLAECAAWQLQAIHSREEMAAQIAPTRTPSTPK